MAASLPGCASFVTGRAAARATRSCCAWVTPEVGGEGEPSAGAGIGDRDIDAGVAELHSGTALPVGERFGVDPLPESADPAAERRRRLPRRPVERDRLELAGPLGGDRAHGLEQRPDPAHADHPARQRSKRRRELAGQQARVGDQPPRRGPVHDQGGSELGDERARRELPIDERGGIRHPLDLSGKRPRRLDAPELLGLRRPDHPLELHDPRQLSIKRRLR